MTIPADLQIENFNWGNATTRMPLSGVFTEKRRAYINELGLFAARFHTIPHLVEQLNIDCQKAGNWLLEYYKNEIKDVHYHKMISKTKKIMEYDNVLFVLFEDLVICFDTCDSIVKYLFHKTPVPIVETVIAGIFKFRNRKEKRRPEISLLVNASQNIETKELRISKPKLNIEDNYNDDFKEIHQTIHKRLSKKNDKGLVMLHGKPGTGKTNYIRYLICSLKKKIIFLPPNMAGAITNPNLVAVLIDNPNSIFVIEDAENIVVDREQSGHSPVSALLNICDGLLSDCLNIQVICSFNTDISKVDSALMRKGRLIAQYEFKELEIQKAAALSHKLGFKTIVHSPMTLAAIYNQEERGFQQVKSRNKIGFGVAVN